MTSTQLAREECSNFNPDGTCLGMDINKDGSMKPLWDKSPKRCVILDAMECRFYEECVLAGIPAISSEKKANEWQEAADEYNQRRKHEPELGRDDLERIQDADITGVCKETTPAHDLGGRPSGDPTGAGFVHLQGPGSLELDRIEESGLSLSRI